MKGWKFQKLVALVDRLRGPEGCPWDREQTFKTLKPLLLEEAYETLEALDTGDRKAFCNELGDLIFQVVFLSQIAEAEGSFDIDDVTDQILRKMIRRHPHVFSGVKAETSDQVLDNWEVIKRAERLKVSPRGTQAMKSSSILDNLPRLPALLTANKLATKVSRVGFDWSHINEVISKLHEEINELREALELKVSTVQEQRIEEEVGDLFFVVVNIARFLGIDPETALRKTNSKFVQRFQFVETSLHRSGKTFKDSNIKEMERLWQEAKKKF